MGHNKTIASGDDFNIGLVPFLKNFTYLKIRPKIIIRFLFF